MNRSELSYDVTWLVRRLFRAMAQRADDYLADSGLTAADRAVLEFLFPDARLTVPVIAARYDVSRQHVQVTVNRLLAAGLVETFDNPRHKRSPLIGLSSLGRDAFAEIRGNEKKLLERIFRGVDDGALKITHNTLQTLLQEIGNGES